MTEEEQPIISKRIFINNVDCYQGNNIAKYLSQCVVGASLEEVDEEAEVEEDVAFNMSKEGCFQIIGTLKNKTSPKPDFVKDIIEYENKEQLYEYMVECDIIVYDITDDTEQIDESVWAVSELHADLERIMKQKIFILISSVMTWAKSKPLDPEDPEIPFTEDDYRRRKPHPNFKEHISAEKMIMKLGKTNKNKLSTFVISSGFTYGGGENLFHYLFKAAWHNEPDLQIFGNGQNILPTIHIKDLAAVVQNIIDMKPKLRYLVAVDDSKNSLEEIVKVVSQSMGSGKTTNIPKEEALMSKGIKQCEFDMLLTNLRMDAAFVKESMHIRWSAETGIIEHIENIVKDYKSSRNLQPIRALVIGPPGAGKSTIVGQLCDRYKLHHLALHNVIADAIEALQRSAARTDATDDDEEDDGKAQEDQELLDAINEQAKEENGRYADNYILRFVKERLTSKPCQNQGFVLDGFPKTIDQARELFSIEDAEEEGDEDNQSGYNKLIMPTTVVCLEANDDFLHERIMCLPESSVTGTHNTEEGLRRRLAEYRANNTEDECVVNYFDELEIHPDKIDIVNDKSQMMKDTVEKIAKLMGPTRNYGLSVEEKEEEERKEQEIRVQKEIDEKEEVERKELEESQLRKSQQEEWTSRLREVKKEEYALLEAQSIPLRNYLMKHVMPTLTQGLINCCKVRPEDSIDYLAEYLFKNNPQID